jgi:hypothetical protein
LLIPSNPEEPKNIGAIHELPLQKSSTKAYFLKGSSGILFSCSLRIGG